MKRWSVATSKQNKALTSPLHQQIVRLLRPLGDQLAQVSSKPGFSFVEKPQRLVQADETEHIFVVACVGGSFEARLDDCGELFPRCFDGLEGGIVYGERERDEMN